MRGKPQRTAAVGGAHGGDSLLQTTEVQISHPPQVVCLLDSGEDNGIIEEATLRRLPDPGGKHIGVQRFNEHKLSNNQYVSILGKC